MQGLTTPPFYVKLSLNLITIALICLGFYLAADIVMPIFFSIVLAVLLIPVENWLTQKKVPRVAAMLISIFLVLLFIVGIIYFLSAQVANFIGDLPKIKQQLNGHWHTAQRWISHTFHFSYKEQNKAIEAATDNMKSSGTGSGVVGSTAMSALGSLVYIILLPLYTFLIMYYRGLIRKFLIDSFSDKHRDSVQEVLAESKTIIQGYMVGLLIEMAIVTILNAIGFFIVGIDYVIFLAVLVAILNMIPYVGMLVAAILCLLITLSATNDVADVLWVTLVLAVVQAVDNNFLMPYVVSSKVRINALVSIVGVLVGGALAGVSGMFLSIPGVAVLKTIFERTDGLKQWGMLMGDDLSMLSAGKRKRIARREAGQKKQS
jgi:predicted PurR-regulated permease PerM